MIRNIKKIGILTSGGDAPGMNAVVRTIALYGLQHHLEIYLIFEGYKGLTNGCIKKADNVEIFDELLSRGGTFLKSSRFKEFKKVTTRKKAISQINKYHIDALICIGGNGTYIGALELSKMGVKCICIPSTIDNDINFSDYAIGFDTCLNTIVECIDKIRDTTTSHQKCSIIEVMGRYCGDLAALSGIASGADLIVTPKNFLNDVEIIKKIKAISKTGKKQIIIVTSEYLYPNIKDLAAKIQKQTIYECRADVLGYVQRGGTPTAFDRVLAANLGTHAIDLLLKNDDNSYCVGLIKNKISHCKIENIGI